MMGYYSQEGIKKSSDRLWFFIRQMTMPGGRIYRP